MVNSPLEALSAKSSGFSSSSDMVSLTILTVFVVSICVFSQAAIKTSFDLYTYESGPESMTFDDEESMVSSHFNNCSKTIFMITGLDQDTNASELIIGAKLIAANRFNVIVVNFETDHYLISLLDNGADIARFIEALVMNLNANRSEIALMGVSYGAHVAGMASQLYRVGRIIGTDPSGPIYDLLPHEIRLDYHDADFVEVMHSSNAYGTLRTKIGHVNYVLNGGNVQPGCSLLDFRCNHKRAAYLYLASVTDCDFHFQRCPSYMAFKLGFCTRYPKLILNPDLDIENVPKDRGVYYYDTEGDDFPYCRPQEKRTTKLHASFC